MQLRSLLEIGARQAEQMDALQKQLAKQAQYASSTMRSVHDLQSQMNAMRNEFIDVSRGVAVSPQVRRADRYVEDRRNNSSPGIAKADATRDRRNSLPTAAKAPLAAQATAPAQDSEVQVQISRVTSAEKAAGCWAVTPSDPKAFTAHGFIRSPPGLSLWSALNCEGVHEPHAKEEGGAGDADVPAVAGPNGGSGLEFLSSIMSGDAASCIQAVMSANAEAVNMADSEGMTALHYAAIHGHADVCRVILSRPEFHSAQAGDRSSNTAMHVATLHDRGEVCAVILEHDPAAALVANRFGDTPLDIARRRGDPSVCASFRGLWSSRHG